MTEFDWNKKIFEAGSVFTPGSPVNARDLFAGRIVQLQKLVDAISQSGFHAVLFGERGVGKTSLSNILIENVQQWNFLVARVNCDAGDDYTSLWRKAFREITYTAKAKGPGFVPALTQQVTVLADTLPAQITPDDVRRTLTQLGQQARVLIVFDEYDRLSRDMPTDMMVSDTIKALSDFGVNATILLIGVAESIDTLVAGHQSVERALVQIPMPRMSPEEIATVVRNGMMRLGLLVGPGACEHLVDLSQGLPYITHLLALNSTKAALIQHSTVVERKHVDIGIQTSLEQWQQSIRTAYYNAVKSAQPGNIYREVLLACALSEVDELGYFTAASVRGPLKKITGRSLDIPNFSTHLKQFSEETRGGIIDRVGQARRLRYRFASPLMRPYVVMRGYADGLLK